MNLIKVAGAMFALIISMATILNVAFVYRLYPQVYPIISRVDALISRMDALEKEQAILQEQIKGKVDSNTLQIHLDGIKGSLEELKKSVNQLNEWLIRRDHRNY